MTAAVILSQQDVYHDGIIEDASGLVELTLCQIMQKGPAILWVVVVQIQTVCDVR